MSGWIATPINSHELQVLLIYFLYTDECEGVFCEYGSMCNRGSCMCPTCTEIYDPVCGSNMETYNSPCHLQAAMCNQRNKIDVLFVGECDGR